MNKEAYTKPHNMDEFEVQEWLESLDSVLESSGPEVATEILERLRAHAKVAGIDLPFTANTPYANTIPRAAGSAIPGRSGTRTPHQEPDSLERDWPWSCARTASSTTLADIFRRTRRPRRCTKLASTIFSARAAMQFEGDTVYFQGHAAPGIYSRAFLEGRLSTQKLENFRRELKPGGGLIVLSAPVADAGFLGVSDGIDGPEPVDGDLSGALRRYLENRGMKPKTDAKVWAFLGDGETDEPESLGAITLASREKLDNLIFVMNCNLQRLDGPVRGNGQIIQELESAFRGARWNVIKVLWGSEWDPILERDTEGLLVKRMGELVDGEYQKLVVESGAYVRAALFRHRSALAQTGRAAARRSAAPFAPWRTRSAQGLRGVQGRGRTQGRRRPSFWRARSRAMALAKRAKARTSRTSRKS